jgi:hypothetical protein
MDAILLIIGIVYESLLNQYNNALISYFHLSYHFSPFENENYHRFVISLQANNLTSLSPYATDLKNYQIWLMPLKKSATVRVLRWSKNGRHLINYRHCLRIVIKSIQQCKYFTLNNLSYHFSPFGNENYHRFVISLQANNLTALSEGK